MSYGSSGRMLDFPFMSLNMSKQYGKTSGHNVIIK